jgi:hypothetical protein
MYNPLCDLLAETPAGTPVVELMMNGEDVSRVETFERYDRKTGLVYFTNSDNSTFVAVCDRIDMIEFEGNIVDWDDADESSDC